MYFDKIKSALLDSSTDEDVLRLRAAALTSMENDESLQQLVPYFVQFIAEKVTHSTGNVYILRTMMELANALTRNPTLFVDPYTTTLTSSVITCLVGRRPATAATNPEEAASFFALRGYAASLVGHIANKYQKSSTQLKPRLARTFLKFFLDPKKPLDQHYGALKGLVAIGGKEAVRMLIIPNLKAYNRVLAKGMAESPRDAEMVLGALVAAVKSIADEPVLGGDGDAMDEDLGGKVEEFVGGLVGGQIEKMGDRELMKSVLGCKTNN